MVAKKKDDNDDVVLEEHPKLKPQALSAEDSQRHIVEMAQRHLELFGVQPEAPAPHFAPNVVEPELRARLVSVRDRLIAANDFELGQAANCVNQAIEWFDKNEATTEP